MAVIDSMAIRVVTNAKMAAGDMASFGKAVEVVGKVSAKSHAPVKLIGEYLEKIGPGGTAKVAGASLVLAAGGMELLASKAGSTQKPMRSLLGWLVRIGMLFIPGGAIVRGVLIVGSLTAGMFGLAKGAKAANDSFVNMIATFYELDKRAQKIGITTEALGGLRFAANQTGVDTQKLDVALEKMNIRIAEAARGGGEAVTVLQRLGLNAKELNMLRPEDKFLAIADALERIPNQSDKLVYAAKLFEEEGTALVNTLAVGREGLLKYMRDAKALGVAPDSFDTAAAVAYAKQLDRTSKAWQKLRNDINATFLPMKSFFSWGMEWLARFLGMFTKLYNYLSLFKFLPGANKTSGAPTSTAVMANPNQAFQRQELTARSAGDLETYSASRRNLNGQTMTPLGQIAKNTGKTAEELQRIREAQKTEMRTDPQAFDMGVAI